MYFYLLIQIKEMGFKNNVFLSLDSDKINVFQTNVSVVWLCCVILRTSQCYSLQLCKGIMGDFS